MIYEPLAIISCGAASGIGRCYLQQAWLSGCDQCDIDGRETTRRFQTKQDGSKLNDTHQLQVYADGVSILGGSVHTVKRNTEAIILASNKTGLEVNDNTKYMVMTGDQNAGRRNNIETGKKKIL